MNHTPHDTSNGTRPARVRIPRIVSVGLACSCAFGLLIWLKLRVVSDVPRTAYADPNGREVTPPAEASEPASKVHADPSIP